MNYFDFIINDLNNHVIVAGFGRVGRIVSYILKKEQSMDDKLE